MNARRDPPRLLDPRSSAPDAVRSALRAGRARLPEADQLARLAAKLPLGGGPGPSGSGPEAPPLGAGAASLAAPSVLPGVLIGAALAVALVGASWWREMRAVAPASSAVVGARREPMPAPEAPRLPAPPERSEPVSLTVVRPFPPAAPRPPAAPQEARATESAAPTAPSPSAGPSVAASPTAPREGFESESQLLQRAHDALSNPAEALRITDEHLARFPAGMLSQEREVLAVTALLALGRSGEARARAARFVALHPTSAYRGRIEVLIPDLNPR
ncbi:putative Fe-S oxidoreductase [Minicystis rosea]|nr:putative Fe-S oxidoreductase [Minicystis rosea]